MKPAKLNHLIIMMLIIYLVGCSNTSSSPPAQSPTDTDRQTINVEDYFEVPKVETETKEVSVILPGDDKETNVTVQVLDGLYLWEGDIVVAEESEIDVQSVGINSSSRLWPDAIIPYVIHPSASVRKSDIEKAITEWNTNTTITLIPLAEMPADKQEDFVSFRNEKPICSSKIGKTGGEQFINIFTKCTVGSIIHEIGHAAGLFHEQARSDRNDYITVLEENIKANRLSQFSMHTERPGWGKDLGTTFDYDSIMHYPWYAFSISCSDKASPNCKATILPKAPVNKNRIGQRIGLSEGDIAGIAELYPKRKAVTISDFKATPEIGPSPLKTIFTWLVSNPNASESLACTLDIDSDGTVEYSFDCKSQLSQEHTYTGADAFEATLSVKDGESPTITKTTFVYVERPNGNQAPTVNAGLDQTLDFEDANFVSLSASVEDDGLPNPPASVGIQWSKQSGPGDVDFGQPNNATTLASFSKAGNYILRLTANDGDKSSFDELSITINEAAPEINSFDYVGDENDNGRIELNEYAYFTASAKGGVAGPYIWSFTPTPVSFEQIDRTSPDDVGALSFKVAFSSVGEKDVCIQVKDSTNQSSKELCRSVTVTANPTGPVSGIWETTYGNMQFYANGTGEYTSDSGKLQFSLSGTTMTGIWIEPSSAQECESDRGGSNYWGKFEFIFDEEFTSFLGSWGYCEEAPIAENIWDGTKK